jgi:predicted GH43/DUF377 family glycosyl hydrolase
MNDKVTYDRISISEAALDWKLVLDHIRTPNKAGRLLLAPSYIKGTFDSHAVDCPFLFFHEDAYWMTYVGWDGAGYRTGLARSTELLAWEKQGMILDRGPAGSPTAYNAAMTAILRENGLYSHGRLKQVEGRFVGTYHAYPNPGYEEGPASIGLCTSTDLLHWQVEPPFLHPDPGSEWESGGLYKSWLLEHEGTYYLFYNAKNQPQGGWHEQTGLVTSPDLVHWTRYAGNPLLKVGPTGAFDDYFASDPCVLQVEGGWAMFYFGNSSDGHARDSAAFSNDLLHWEKAGEVLIDVGPAGSVDSRYAHKAGITARDERLYHFYCAVSPAEDPHLGEIEHSEVRGISAAWS